ncbi:MAG: peptide deformylase [Patescibacteria group bacterium]
MQKVSPIVTEGNPILRLIAEPVPITDIPTKKIKDAIKRMTEALRATNDGIGIAAPQIGLSLRIFLASEEALAIDRSDPDDKPPTKKEPWTYYVFINPEIIKTSSKKIRSTEGCLSVPKHYGTVARAEKVKIRAYDEFGKRFERSTSNLFARLMQHEVDHLNGILYIDKAENISRPL